MTATRARDGHLPPVLAPPLVLGLVALGLAACGSADETGTDATPPTTTYTSSPLEPYLPVYTMSTDEQRSASLAAQELMATCMKEQGFDYDQPYQPDQPLLPLLGDLTPVRWAELYGYGVSTLGTTTAAGGGDVTERSAAEQAAYDAALYGSPTDPEGDDGTYDWEQQGCMGAAYHEATGGADEVMRDARYAELAAAVDVAREQAASSAATAALDEEWAACLADAGYPGRRTPAAAALEARTAWQEAGGTAASEETRADLRAAEVALAVADAICQTDLGYPARSEQIVWAAEAALVAERHAELEALVADAG